jgi:hypothetical protein
VPDLHPGDKLRITISDREVRLAPAAFAVASTSGSVEPLADLTDGPYFEEQIAIARQDRVHRLLNDLQSS